jgi:hypothetical protein
VASRPIKTSICASRFFFISKKFVSVDAAEWPEAKQLLKKGKAEN